MSSSLPQPIGPGKLVLSFFYVLGWLALLLALAGDWLWLEGWVFGLWYVVLSMTTLLHLYRRDPALLAERFRITGAPGEKPWDRYVIAGLAVGWLAWIVLMPLDAKRYAWTSVPPWLHLLGGLALVPAFFFFYRAFVDNTYASALVRIQTERHQQVVSTGVYGFVRHPMYLGGSLMFLGAPLLLGSLWGLLIGAALTLLLAGRSLGEEKMLLTELEGYAEYQKKVRYRLLPHLW